MNSDRDFRTIVGELKDEVVESAQTRLALLKTELRERAVALKYATPLLAIGAVFLLTAFLVFTATLVTLASLGFTDSPYRWFFASLIVGILWSIVGAVALYTGVRRMKRQALVPLKTVQVLSDDKSRLQENVKKAA